VTTNYFPFEAVVRRQIRRLKAIMSGSTPVGYVDQDGDVAPVQGDEFGPYVNPMGLGSADGETGAVEVTSGSPTRILTDLFGKLFTVPAPLLTDEVTLVADAALAAAGAFTASTIIDVRLWRTLNLSVRYSPGAAGGFPDIIPFRAKTASEPLTTADSWYGFGVNDGSVNPQLMTGAFPAGTDATIEPEWGTVTERPLALRTELGNAATDEIRMDVELNVTSVKWVYILYAERGVAGTPGVLGLRYNLSS